MTRKEKIERKVTLQLARLVQNEEAELAKLRRWRNHGYEIGGLLVMLSLYASGRAWWPEWVNTLIASVGGVLIGLGVLFDSGVNQWPILKQFIDGPRLEQTVHRYGA